MKLIITQSTINNSEVNSVNARDLWENLEVKTEFSKWMQRKLDEAMFVLGQDYLIVKTDENSGRPRIDYIVTVEMAKHLALVEKTGKGFEVRQYFIDAEKELRTLAPKPMSQLEIMQFSINQLIEQSSRMAVLENKLTTIEANQAVYRPEYYTIGGYMKMRGIKHLTDSQKIKRGKQARSLSESTGIEFTKIPHTSYGTINSYHVDILDTVFENELA